MASEYGRALVHPESSSVFRMTTLPAENPKFTHEAPQHIDGTNEREPHTNVPIFDFDQFCCGAHGLAILIETEIEGEPPRTTLFDSGPDSLSLIRNIKGLKINAGQVERLVLSHWHSDHSGGILSFLKHRQEHHPEAEPVHLDLHPSRPDLRGIAPGPTFDQVKVAIPKDPTFEEIEALAGIVEKRSDGHAIAGDMMWVSGEIPRETSFEQGLRGSVRLIERAWKPEEHIMDERYGVVDVAGKGLVIFSSCSHAGIVNVVIDAVKTFQRPVYMIIGGLHLAGPEYAERIPLTVDFLSKKLKPGPSYILPLHCSGFQAKIAIEKAFGEGCVPCSTGMKMELWGDRSVDERLYCPSY